MKRYILAACAGLLVAVVATPSFAADLPRPAYKAPFKATKNPVYVAPFSWTGFYVGINGGYGLGKSSWTTAVGSTGDFDVKGALVGGTVGYNLQTGGWVWGIEADGAASWIQGTGPACGGCETRNNWLITGRGSMTGAPLPVAAPQPRPEPPTLFSFVNMDMMATAIEGAIAAIATRGAPPEGRPLAQIACLLYDSAKQRLLETKSKE